MKQSETAHSETHMHVDTCTNSWNSKQPACMQPTERFLRMFALCSSSANTNVKAYAKEPTKWHCQFTLCSLFYNNVQKENNIASKTHEKTCRGTAGYSTGLKHWSVLNDNISYETFSAQYTHLFSMHLLGDGYTTFTCRLQRGSCKVFVWKRSISNANLHKHQALHEDGR